MFSFRLTGPPSGVTPVDDPGEIRGWDNPSLCRVIVVQAIADCSASPCRSNGCNTRVCLRGARMVPGSRHHTRHTLLSTSGDWISNHRNHHHRQSHFAVLSLPGGKLGSAWAHWCNPS